VWVDAWMNRPDLRDDYATRGWQMLDATPRKIGSHTIVTGPVSVRAIKERKELSHDTKYVIDELNANIQFFFQPEDSYKLAESHSRGLVITKDVGQFSRVDITENYKLIKKSRKEKNATSLSVDKERFIDFSIEPSHDLECGNEVTFTVTAKPPTSDSYTVSLIATVQPVDYIGRVGKVIKKVKDEKRIIQTREQGLKAKFLIALIMCLHYCITIV